MALNISKSNIGTVILFGLVWITLIISYSSYWYKMKIETYSIGNSTSTDDDYTITVETKYNQYHVKQESAFGSVSGTQSIEETDANRNQLAIYKVCLAFSVIGWVVSTVCIVLIMVNITGLFSKLPSIFSLVAKFLPIFTLICCLLAVFVFIGLPNATKRDCLANGGTEDTCTSDQTTKFVGSQSVEVANSGTKTSWGPTTSWATAVCATAFQLVATIVNLVFVKYGESVTPQ